MSNVARAAPRRRTLLPAAITGLVGATAWTPSQAVSPGIYEISTEMIMPHLEENLRYARTQERRCIRARNVSDFFPILRHQSLNGCKLAAGNRGEDDATYYSLVCDDGQETTGTAQLSVVAGRAEGILQIQMGGKNMTFSQRIEAERQGDCNSQP